MRLGASPYGSDRASALALADAVVAAGIDTLWLGDGIFRRPDFAGWRGGLESMTELAWCAGRHPGVRVGITAAVLPLRDIDWLAREAATLDHLTEGRFVLAVAAGFWDDELAYRGVDPAQRGPELRRRLAILRNHLDTATATDVIDTATDTDVPTTATATDTDATATAHAVPHEAAEGEAGAGGDDEVASGCQGATADLVAATTAGDAAAETDVGAGDEGAGRLSPAAFTPGGPPIWLAGGSATMRLALAQGLPFQASRALPDELAPVAQRWFDQGGGLLAHRIYVEAGGGDGDGDVDVPDGVQVRRHVFTGSAQALTDGLAAYGEMGVGDLSLVLGHDDASARRTLDVLADVLPALGDNGTLG